MNGARSPPEVCVEGRVRDAEGREIASRLTVGFIHKSEKRQLFGKPRLLVTNGNRLEAYPTLGFRRDEPRPGRKHSVERDYAPSEAGAK